MGFKRNSIVESEFFGTDDVFSVNIDDEESGDQVGVAHGRSSAEAIQIANEFAAARDLLSAAEQALPYLLDHVARTRNEGPGDRIAHDALAAAIGKARGKRTDG